MTDGGEVFGIPRPTETEIEAENERVLNEAAAKSLSRHGAWIPVTVVAFNGKVSHVRVRSKSKSSIEVQ